ncbi:hypothetical protein PX701_05130 [Agromyces sp. H3Y2-19a]|uniref:DUF2231 domain-containing protein n=1 Tax=Agromyces TaxID=33877 RepID=UPI001E2AF45B|nr:MULTISPECIES: DUF2231 domain-containing protein [Agromyces]MCD5346639.1 hypothetical protein [Agromyces sp. S2-1-8]MDF0512999.1 hypothetical protein [Agromyces chromiiresistens]
MDSTIVAPLASGDLIQVAGLPLHPLIVHAVVVLTPLTVLALLLGTFWPRARRRLGIVTALGAALVLVLVPITVAAGRSLAAVLGPIPAVARHQGFGEMLLPWAIALFVVAAGQWAWFRFADDRVRRDSPGAARAVRVGLAAASLVVGVGTMVLLVLIGDSGARAVWGGLPS